MFSVNVKMDHKRSKPTEELLKGQEASAPPLDLPASITQEAGTHIFLSLLEFQSLIIHFCWSGSAYRAFRAETHTHGKRK